MGKTVTVGDLEALPPAEVQFVIEYCKDWDPRRAAEAAGFAGDTGYRLLQKDTVIESIRCVLTQRLERSHYDAEWLLQELVDNHYIARHRGEGAQSNQALGLIMKHRDVDAVATQRSTVGVVASEELVERIRAGRRRLAQEVSFMEIPESSG